MDVLFLCTGNSCRSIIAEATFNHLAPKGWRAMSAGSQPSGKVHPHSLALLQRKGIDTEGYYSKSWNHLPQAPDIIITVCGNADQETCPIYLNTILRTHWGLADPAQASVDMMDLAFEETYRILRCRIEAFFNLPLDSLRHKTDLLKSELDKIGSI